MLSIRNENIDSVINEPASQEKPTTKLPQSIWKPVSKTLMLGRSPREVYIGQY